MSTVATIEETRHRDGQLGGPATTQAPGWRIEASCGTPGCPELWWKLKHETFKLPRIPGHHWPGH